MQFKHSELLYALFFLLIPIFIHLFQLRKFQKVAFTNVAFLKKVSIQTRKSSQLKKWLTLLMRLLALACIILAFAQPFSASKTAIKTEKETVLYLDNSFSMQVKGSEGPLLQNALQQLYSKSFSTEKISWFTNNYSKRNSSLQDFKNKILEVDYTQSQLSLENVLLKASQLFSDNSNSEKRLIIISDFQQKENFPEINSSIKVNAVQLKPQEIKNISIDTTYITKENTGNSKLFVQVSAEGNVLETIPISLFNGKQLVSKTAINFDEQNNNSETKTISFDINDNNGFIGKLSLVDPNLTFDNSLYFNINKAQKIKVLTLNNTSDKYLQRIFNQDEFAYTHQNFESLNYSAFTNQNLIILNELSTIPPSLGNALKSFIDNGGSVFIIPSNKSDMESYNVLLTKLQMGSFSELVSQEKKITNIVFNHPIYKNVFEKQVVNFQYPKVNSYFIMNTLATSILKFEDQKPFIIQKGNCFVSTASISSENSNFQSSPLIVPTLYNMAKQSLTLPKLYFEIGKQNHFSVPIQLGQDEILKIKDSIFSFIPLQQTKATQVNISTENEPSISGIYTIEKGTEYLENVSYNYNRNESTLHYVNPKNWNNVTVHSSLNELFNSISEENTINNYWKWFVIFALLFLIAEMLILKFLKN